MIGWGIVHCSLFFVMTDDLGGDLLGYRAISILRGGSDHEYPVRLLANPDASLQIYRTAHPIEGGFEYPPEQALRRSLEPEPAMAPDVSIRKGTNMILQRLLEKRLKPTLKRFRIL